LAVVMNITFDRSNGTSRIVIAEILVLLGVQYLQQGRGRIPAPIRADLVHLVEDEHGVVRLCAPDRLQDAAGHGANVRAAVAAYLSLVVHATQGGSRELAAHSARDRLTQGGLTHARRPDEAQDRLAPALGRFSQLLQAPDRQVFDDSLLHLVEVVMISVQDRPRGHHVHLAAGRRVPRQ